MLSSYFDEHIRTYELGRGLEVSYNGGRDLDVEPDIQNKWVLSVICKLRIWVEVAHFTG